MSTTGKRAEKLAIAKAKEAKAKEKRKLLERQIRSEERKAQKAEETALRIRLGEFLLEAAAESERGRKVVARLIEAGIRSDRDHKLMASLYLSVTRNELPPPRLSIDDQAVVADGLDVPDAQIPNSAMDTVAGTGIDQSENANISSPNANRASFGPFSDEDSPAEGLGLDELMLEPEGST